MNFLHTSAQIYSVNTNLASTRWFHFFAAPHNVLGKLLIKFHCCFFIRLYWYICAISPLPSGPAWLHLHRTLCRCLQLCTCKVNCPYLHAVQNSRGGEAALAHAPSRRFELSAAFINYDESPLHFTSNQRALTGTQIWSPLTKWFSWRMWRQAAIELATWWYGCCLDCSANGPQLDPSFLKQCGEWSSQLTCRGTGWEDFRGPVGNAEIIKIKRSTLSEPGNICKGAPLTLPLD